MSALARQHVHSRCPLVLLGVVDLYSRQVLFSIVATYPGRQNTTVRSTWRPYARKFAESPYHKYRFHCTVGTRFVF